MANRFEQQQQLRERGAVLQRGTSANVARIFSPEPRLRAVGSPQSPASQELLSLVNEIGRFINEEGEIEQVSRNLLNRLDSRQRFGVQVYLDNVESTATGVSEVLDWEDKNFEVGTDTFWKSTGNPSRLVVPFAGYWKPEGMIIFDGNATGYRQIEVLVNGVSLTRPLVAREPSPIAAVDTILPVPNVSLELDKGDYIECEVFQNSGGNLNIETSSLFGIFLEARGLAVA